MIAFIKVPDTYGDTIVNVAHIVMYETLSYRDCNNETLKECTWMKLCDSTELEFQVDYETVTLMIARALSNADRGVYVPVGPENVVKAIDTERDLGPKAPY